MGKLVNQFLPPVSGSKHEMQDKKCYAEGKHWTSAGTSWCWKEDAAAFAFTVKDLIKSEQNFSNSAMRILEMKE